MEDPSLYLVMRKNCKFLDSCLIYRKTTIHKLRSQNETLRTQLRDLSYKLTEALEKIRPKNPQAVDKSIPEFKEETLHKELENSNKQLAMYKREIQLLRNRVDTDQAEFK